MTPIHPTATPQRGFLEDPTISAIRPFGLLFPNARLTVPNETALMRIVSNFRDLKLNELDDTQRALIVQYLCFYAEKAVIEEGICFQPAPTLNLNNAVGRIGQRDGTQQVLHEHERTEYGVAHDSRKRKRAIQQSNLGRYEVEGDSKRMKEATKDAEIDDLVRRLEPIRFALGGGFTVEHITAARRDFLAGVKDLTILTGGSNNHQLVSAFSVTEAVEITNYFFTTILGNDLQQRIAALVESWNSGAIEHISHAGDSRAIELARDESIPLPLRTFYRHFAQANRLYLDVETPHSTLMRHKENLALQVQWLNLTSKKSGFKKELVQYVKSPNGKKRFRGAIKEHICSNLSIASTDNLEDAMEAGRGIRTLVNYFGCGILVILPARADKMFRGWAQSKISSVFKLFKRTMGNLRHLCNTLEAKIYDPIMAGRALPMLPRSTQEYSLYQMLRSLDIMDVKREVADERISVRGENVQTDEGSEEHNPMREPISQDRW